MPSYKLSYFNARGGAEISRLVFAAAGVDYTDDRLVGEEWQARKAGTPLGQIPVLNVDGKELCQGAAIARFLAREFGLMGENNFEAFRIEELYEAMMDVMRDLVKGYFEKEEKKAAMKKTMLEETLPKFLCFFEKRLCENGDGKGFFVGDKLSLADLIVFHGLSTVTKVLSCSDVCDKCPKLKAHCEKVSAVPGIAAWLKKRPVTEF